MNSFRGIVLLHGKIECKTGLHIGGVGTGYEIGGMDNPVIRDPVSGYPYIPGSSLKGKMRSIMEWVEGRVPSNGGIHSCKELDCPICRIFGSSAAEDRRGGPTRLAIRDAHPDNQTRESMDELEATQGLPKVEVKTENNINRITSATLSGPRSQERVPVDSRFDFEMLYGIYDIEKCQVSDVDLLPKVFQAMRLLEDSALGGGGSRGSGRIAFHILSDPAVRRSEDYREGKLEGVVLDSEKLVRLDTFDVTAFQETVRGKLG